MDLERWNNVVINHVLFKTLYQLLLDIQVRKIKTGCNSVVLDTQVVKKKKIKKMGVTQWYVSTFYEFLIQYWNLSGQISLISSTVSIGEPV